MLCNLFVEHSNVTLDEEQVKDLEMFSVTNNIPWPALTSTESHRLDISVNRHSWQLSLDDNKTDSNTRESFSRRNLMR